MEGVLGGVFHTVLRAPAFHARAQAKTEPDVLTELQRVQLSLESVTSRFDCATDPDIVESCIYEMQALTSRYRHLLRQARQMNLSRPVVVASEPHTAQGARTLRAGAGCALRAGSLF